LVDKKVTGMQLHLMLLLHLLVTKFLPMKYSSKNIEINGIVVKPGQTAQVHLNKYQLPTKTIIEIPVYIFSSKKPGPTILLQAGMHGDELNGIEVVRRLITRKDVTHPLCGAVVAIPVINTFAFLYKTRDLPDGKDLNRCFPGTRNGSLGSRIAYDLTNQIIPQIDIGLDFHTGGKQINNYPQLRCTFDDKHSLELAKIFSPTYIINSSFRDGSLRKEAYKKGKQVLVYEGGESSRFHYSFINEGVNGCLRLMKHFKMIDATIRENESIIIHKNTWLRAKSSGMFHCSKPSGVPVEKGEVIAHVTDPFGEHQENILAPHDGYIIAINNQPVVNQGDALLHLGMG
jgi:uncharacterized protein